MVQSSAIEHLLAVVILIGRLGDVWSTLSITPTLRLEANPLVRKFRRIMLPAGFVLCLTPYYSTALGASVAVCFLLVAGSNFSRGWLARALGEAEYHAILVRAAERSSLATALRFVFLAGLFTGLAGALLLVLSGGTGTWGFWVGVGVLMYAFASTVHVSSYLVRLFRAAHRNPAAHVA